MSLVHMSFEKLVQTDTKVEYEVMSIDFNDEHEWKPIAKLTIDKLNRDYSFEQLGDWKELNIIHPKRYLDATDDDVHTMHSGAAGYCGAWTGRIHAWAMRLIQEQMYPPIYPG